MINNLKTIQETIGDNTYPGRGIIVGRSENGIHAATAYFIMGRSENSRNRVFSRTADTLYTEAADPSKVEDPSLIMYTALRRFGNFLVVTNGDQTDTVYEKMLDGDTFEIALETRTFEPDEPNFTPRISALIHFGDNDFTYKMSILKSLNAKGTSCTRQFFNYESLFGVGHFIHTYQSNGDPLPSFCGEPKRVYIPNSCGAFAHNIWDALDKENRIALYVCYTNVITGKCDEETIIQK